MSVHKRINNGTYYVAYRDGNGRQHTRSFGKGRDGKREAEKFDEQVRNERRSKGRKQLSPEERVAVFRDPRTQAVIAQEFGVSQTTVSKIKRNGP